MVCKGNIACEEGETIFRGPNANECDGNTHMPSRLLCGDPNQTGDPVAYCCSGEATDQIRL